MSDSNHHGNLPTEPTLVVDDPENAAWDRGCDLLVVGLGAAGSATAIAGKEAGVDVCVADRFGMGGATAKSGGIIYAGGGTRHQKKAGYEDTAEQMFRYLQLEVEDAVSETTLRRFCDESRDLLSWLESLGAQYGADAHPPKTSYPPPGRFLYFSGNEPVAPFHTRPRLPRVVTAQKPRPARWALGASCSSTCAPVSTNWIFRCWLLPRSAA